MNLTNKQKLFWLAGIAVAVIYFAPRFVRFGPPLPMGGRPAPTQPNRNSPPARPGVPTPASGLPANGATIPPQPLPFDSLVGAWQGFVPPSGSSFCTMKFELRRKTGAPDKYAGFPELLCMPTSAMAGGGFRPGRIPSMPQMNPVSAILTGTAASGSIAFTVDKTIGASSDGCSLSAFNVTPFGADQIDVDWQTGNCDKPQRGQMMLRRTGR